MTCSSVRPTASVRGGPPELLTSTSMPPCASTAVSTSRSASSALVTSPATASAPRRPASRSSTSRRRANITTFAPSSASASATPSPIPADAPQTIAVRPSRWRSTSFPLQDAHDLADRRGRRPYHLLLLGRQLQLDDLLDPSGAQLRGHAHVEASDPVLALEVRGARQHALLVEADGVDHLGRRGARRIPRRGPEQAHDLAPADLRPLDELPDARLREELGERDPADGRGGD